VTPVVTGEQTSLANCLNYLPDITWELSDKKFRQQKVYWLVSKQRGTRKHARLLAFYLFIYLFIMKIVHEVHSIGLNNSIQ